MVKSYEGKRGVKITKSAGLVHNHMHFVKSHICISRYRLFHVGTGPKIIRHRIHGPVQSNGNPISVPKGKKGGGKE